VAITRIILDDADPERVVTVALKTQHLGDPARVIAFRATPEPGAKRISTPFDFGDDLVGVDDPGVPTESYIDAEGGFIELTAIDSLPVEGGTVLRSATTIPVEGGSIAILEP